MGRLPRHVTHARREQLRELLRRQTYLPISRVCQVLGVSEATARRDLASLERQHHVRRTRGGALCPYAGGLGDFERHFTTFDQRRQTSGPAKHAIAAAAAALVKPGMTVFVDAGTTCFAVAEALAASAPGEWSDLPETAITVVTHNLAVAVKLAPLRGVRVEVLGGTLLPRQAALFGDEGCRGVSARRIDLALLGGEGFDADGVWNSQQDVIRLQRAAMAAAQRSALLLDSAKLGHRGPERLAAWPGIPLLITDSTPVRLRRAGIRLPAGRLVSVRPAPFTLRP